MPRTDRKTAAVCVAACLCGVLISQTVAAPRQPEKPPSPFEAMQRRAQMAKETADVVQAGNRFAFDLYQKLRGQVGNLFFSPASISMALAMACEGSADGTRTEMSKVLHIDGLANDRLDAQMKQLRQSWKSSNKGAGYRLDVANRLWGQEGFAFLPTYLKTTGTVYGAELGRLDFRAHADQARQTINAWVEDNTQRKIKNLVPVSSVLQDARLVLTNAVYFKGDWSSPFVKGQTREEDFLVGPGHTVKTAMMHQRHKFGYTENDDLQALKMDYGDGSMSMIVLLPRRPNELAALEQTLTADGLQNLLKTLEQETVIVAFPRFTTTAEFQLADVLRAMGMPSAFNADAADFSGMTGKKDLFISAVLHKAFVEVNEEGTEAAAATGIVMTPMAARITHGPKVFRADHPFLFLIRDERTQAVLFVGRMTNPAK